MRSVEGISGLQDGEEVKESTISQLNQSSLVSPEEILEMWKVDSVIDKILLDESLRNIPQLHSKYVELLVRTKFQLRTFERQLKDIPYVEKKTNPKYQLLENSIGECKDSMDALEKIISSINSMSYTIGHMVKWRAWTSGATDHI